MPSTVRRHRVAFMAAAAFILGFPQPVSAVTYHSKYASYLNTNQYLKTNEYIRTKSRTNGASFFTVMQGDGNLCTYAGTDPGHNKGYRWCANSAPVKGQSFFAIMQGDGHLCVYHGTGPADNKGFVWCAADWDKTKSTQYGYHLLLNGDGYLYVREAECGRYQWWCPKFRHCYWSNNPAHAKQDLHNEYCPTRYDVGRVDD